MWVFERFWWAQGRGLILFVRLWGVSACAKQGVGYHFFSLVVYSTCTTVL